MFKFNFPKWAYVEFKAATGAVMRMIHIGNGEFISEVPPIMIDGVAPVSADVSQASEVQAITWDGTIMDGRTPVNALRFVFDAPSAMAALRAAADRGEVPAIAMLQRFQQAQAQVEAAEA